MMPGAELVAGLVLFASTVSGLPQPHSTPVIELISPQALQAEECRGCRWEAYTDKNTGHITLKTTWRQDTVGNCVLAHELTHWLQWNAGQLQGATSQQVEPPAYRVTAACAKAYNDPMTYRWASQQARVCSRQAC